MPDFTRAVKATAGDMRLGGVDFACQSVDICILDGILKGKATAGDMHLSVVQFLDNPMVGFRTQDFTLEVKTTAGDMHLGGMDVR